VLDAARPLRTRRAIDPLFRRATTFVVRRPSWGLTIGVATAALALAASTAPLVTEAAADRAFHQEAVAAEGLPPGTGIDARASTPRLADAAAAAAVTERLDTLDVYGSPTMSVRPTRPYSGYRHPVPLIAAGDVRATGVVFAVGDAVSALRTIGDTAPAPGAVWLPDTLAAELGASAGDTVELGLVVQLTDADLAAGADPNAQQPLDGIDVPVAGVYATQDGLPVSDGFDWQSIAQQLPRHPELPGQPAPLVLTDTTTAMTLLEGMGDHPFVTWDVGWEGPTTIARGRDAAAALADATDDFLDTHSRVGSTLDNAGADDVRLASGEPDMVQRSDEGAAILDPVLDSIALAALVIAVLVLATCVWLLVASRRRETMLSLARGGRPARVASIVLVELLPALIVGVVAAFAIVRWAPGLVAGDGSIGAHTAAVARRRAIACLPVAALVVFTVAVFTAWRIDPATADRAKRWLSVLRPETIAVVAALAVGAQVLTQNGSLLDSGVGLLFPLLFVIAGALVTVRLLALAIRGGRRAQRRRAATSRRPRSLVLWLGRRRLTSALTQVSMVAVVVAIGVGAFTYTTAVWAAGRDGVSDKEAVIGGARSTVEVVGSAPTMQGDLGFGRPGPGTTVLWTASNAYVGPNIASDVLMVDPATFADAVEWRDAFASQPLDELLTELVGSGPVGLIVAGNYAANVPDDGVLDLDALDLGPRLPVRYHVVARVAALPWQREGSTMMLISAPALASSVPTADGTVPGASDVSALDAGFHSFVWSRLDQSELLSRIDPAAIVTDRPSSNLVSASRLPSFVAFNLALPYLEAVGITIFMVALLGVVVLGGRRRDEVAVELAMADRMALPRRTMRWASVGGAALLGVAGWAVGTLLGVVVATIMIDRLDPAPQLTPGLATGVSTASIVLALVAVVAVAALGALLEVRNARRVPVAEVLRAAE
jgi:hypothetical protein